MPVAQSPAHYINSSKGCPSITESFPLCFLLILWATVTALSVVEPYWILSLILDDAWIWTCDTIFHKQTHHSPRFLLHAKERRHSDTKAVQ
jgi:hypothetical protein